MRTNFFNKSTIINEKSVRSLKITIIKTDTAVATTTAFPHINFIFNIVGLEEYRIKDFMNNRLLK